MPGMGFCQAHWDKLRQVIQDRDLYGFVAGSGPEVAAMLAEGKFEPLMGAHNAILSNAISALGSFVGCPLCLLNATGEDYDAWIRLAVDEQAAQAGKLAAGG